MASDPSNTHSHSLPSKGLPPVTPPSGRFIAQLFLVPGLIVLVAVLLLLLFRSLIGGGYTAESFLRQLDSDNADIRWRGANDLAQVLHRPESVHLKTDAGFALDLAERLRQTLDALDRREKEIAEADAKSEKGVEWAKHDKDLLPLSNSVRFLMAALADFRMAVGVPLIGEVALRTSPNLEETTLLRRQATWALASLGQSVNKEFASLSAEQQAAIRDKLTQESSGTEPRAAWARTALYYLPKDKAGAEHAAVPPVRTDEILAKAAQSEDRFQRSLVAFALRFWDGPLVEPTLIELAHDQGQGTLLEIKERE